MTNSELSMQFAAQLKTGKPFIYSVRDTANPNQKQLEIAQQVPTGTENTEVDFISLSLGWQSTTINRHWHGISTENLAKISSDGPVVGKLVEDAFAALLSSEVVPCSIEVEHYTKETDPLAFKTNVIDALQAGRNPAKPVENPRTKMVMKHNGNEVYRKTKLAVGNFDPAKHLKKLTYDTVEAAVGTGVSQAQTAPAVA